MEVVSFETLELLYTQLRERWVEVVTATALLDAVKAIDLMSDLSHLSAE